MKAEGIYSALSLSFFLHILVAALSFFAAREFYTYHPTVPYIVSLVNPEDTTGNEGVGGPPPEVAPGAPEKQEIAKPAQKPAVNPRMVIPENKKKENKEIKERTEETEIKERIAALRAEKKIEKMAALRKMVDVGRQSAGSSRTLPGNNRAGSSPRGGGADYYSLIQAKIRQQWVYPDMPDKDLETIVSIRIANDGTVTIEKVEKRSGNPLFDRSVLRAITAASPLPRPLHEEEIGVRFSP